MSDSLKIKEKIQRFIENDGLCCISMDEAERANEDYNKNMLSDMRMLKENIVNYVEKYPALPVLYGYHEEFKTIYFDTKEKFLDYCDNNAVISNYIFVIQYLDNFAGKDDVIRIIDISGVEYVAAFASFYYQYVETENGNGSWQGVIGSVADMYRAFRNIGIVFKDDIYGKIEEEEKELTKILESCLNPGKSKL